MSRYHTQYVFSPPWGMGRGGYGSGDSKLHKNMQGYFPRRNGKGAQVPDTVPYTAIAGRVAKGERRPRPLRAPSPATRRGKALRAARGYSPAAVLTSRTVHRSDGTHRGRSSEEVIPGPAEKQESRGKKYGK